MPAQSSYDYALIRVVPRVERQEFVNVGVIVWCREHNVLEARIALNEARLCALDPDVDLDAGRVTFGPEARDLDADPPGWSSAPRDW